MTRPKELDFDLTQKKIKEDKIISYCDNDNNDHYMIKNELSLTTKDDQIVYNVGDCSINKSKIIQPIYKTSSGKRYTYTPEGKRRKEEIPSNAFSSIPIFDNFKDIYTIEDQILGKGAFAVAYKIYDTNNTYALKKLKKPGNTQCRDMFLREITMMEHLKKYLNNKDKTVQNRFVKYYETFLYKVVTRLTYYTLRLGMRLEFLNGIDLKNYLIYKKEREGKKMRIDNVLYIIRELLEALVHLEKARVVHRDIKPDNIMVVHDGKSIQRLVLIDFGIGAILDPSMKILTSGTPNFMPHELIDCNNQIKRSVIKSDICRYYLMADLFSVGVIFYKLTSTNDSYPYKTYYQNNKLMRDVRYRELNCGYDCVDNLVRNMVHGDHIKRFNVSQSSKELMFCINNIIQITIYQLETTSTEETQRSEEIDINNKTIRPPDYLDLSTETYKHSGKSVGSGRIDDINNEYKDLIGSDDDEIEEYNPGKKI